MGSARLAGTCRAPRPPWAHPQRRSCRGGCREPARLQQVHMAPEAAPGAGGEWPSQSCPRLGARPRRHPHSAVRRALGVRLTAPQPLGALGGTPVTVTTASGPSWNRALGSGDAAVRLRGACSLGETDRGQVGASSSACAVQDDENRGSGRATSGSSEGGTGRPAWRSRTCKGPAPGRGPGRGGAAVRGAPRPP